MVRMSADPSPREAFATATELLGRVERGDLMFGILSFDVLPESP